MGAIAGAIPWLIKTVYTSIYGGVYLASTISNISFNPWKFIQNFVFVIPHSLGYSYPGRTIGVVSILFTVFIVFYGIVIFFKIYKLINFKNIKTVYIHFNKIPFSALTGIFVLLLPLFFIFGSLWHD